MYAIRSYYATESGKLIENPYKTWKDVNPALPNVKIEVLGPPPTSGTRDAFVELAMEHGASEFPSIKALKKTDAKAFKTITQTVREDGAYIEAGENDNLIVQKLQANPNAFGIFGFSFLDQNADVIQGSKIEVLGPPPTSGTRDAFVELAMEHGASEFPSIKALKKTDGKAFKAITQTVREDGAYIEAGENDNLIVQKLQANPNAFGIFGFSFLDQNADVIQVV